MAAIEQIITIATNRSGAASDVYSALAGSTAITGITSTNNKINNQHLNTGTSNGQILVQGQAVMNMIPDPNNPGQMIPDPNGGLASDTRYVTEGVDDNKVVREGTGTTSVLRIEDILNTDMTGGFVTLSESAGTVTFANPVSVQLGDAHTYTNTALRNAATDVIWHQGDLAVIPGGTTITPGTMQFPSTLQFANRQDIGTTGPDARDTLISWLTSMTTPNGSGRYEVEGDVTGFIGTDEDNPLGTINIPSGSGFSINNNFLLFFADAATSTTKINISTGPTSAGQTVTFTGPHVPGAVTNTATSATYIYVGTDQTTAAATTDSDWVQIETPFPGITTTLATNPSITPLTMGATSFQIPSFTNGSANATGLGQITYTPAAGSTPASLSINGQAITVGGGAGTVTRNHYGYAGPALTITGLDPDNVQSGDAAQVFNIATTARDDAAGTGNWTLNRGSAAVPTTGWPQNVSLYGLGDKFFYGTDWTVNDEGTMITVTISVDRRRQLGGGEDQNGNFVPSTVNISLEVETLT